MATVDVLIVVDTEGAITSGNLGANVYLMDNQGYLGVGREGITELVTPVANADVVNFSVAPVQAGGVVAIDSFFSNPGNYDHKAAIPKYLDPEKNPVTGEWSSEFKSTDASGTKYQYSVRLIFQGHVMAFDPYLKLK